MCRTESTLFMTTCPLAHAHGEKLTCNPRPSLVPGDEAKPDPGYPTKSRARQPLLSCEGLARETRDY